MEAADDGKPWKNGTVCTKEYRRGMPRPYVWHMRRLHMSRQYNPNIHHRRSIRLPEWDYRTASAYFVTLCTYQKECLFSDPVIRRVVETMWKQVPIHFPHVALDEWVVMPNHVHGILFIADDASRGEALPANEPLASTCAIAETSEMGKPAGECLAPALQSGSLGAVVGNFKSVTSRRVNRMRHTPGVTIWQRNYYERVIRNDRELNAIRQYIMDNPANWEQDTENPRRTV